MSTDSKPTHIQLIYLEKLVEVVFVEDYVQLVFENSGMSIFQYPELQVQGNSIKSDNQNYRAMLLSFAGKTLSKYEFEDNKCFKLFFERNYAILISITPDSYEGPEMIVIDKPNERTIVI